MCTTRQIKRTASFKLTTCLLNKIYRYGDHCYGHCCTSPLDSFSHRYGRLNQLKQTNPALKTTQAVGGWNFGTARMTAMLATAANRDLTRLVSTTEASYGKWTTTNPLAYRESSYTRSFSVYLCHADQVYGD